MQLATEKQLALLAHELTKAKLLSYTERITESGKMYRSTQEHINKLKGLTIDQADFLIKMFRPFDKSGDEGDLLLVRHALKELGI